MGVCRRCGQQAAGSLCMACAAQVQSQSADPAAPDWAALMVPTAQAEPRQPTPMDQFFIAEVPKQPNWPADSTGAHNMDRLSRDTPLPDTHLNSTMTAANGWWSTPPQTPVPPGYGAGTSPPGYASTVLAPQTPVPPGYGVGTPLPSAGVPQAPGAHWPNQAPYPPMLPNTAPTEKSPRGWLLVLTILAVVSLAIAVAIAVIMANRSGAESGAQSTTAPTAVTTVTVPATEPPNSTQPLTQTPTVDPDIAAQAELNRLIAESASWVPLDGQWAAMLGGKWVGITDPLQTNSKGSHTFGAADILAEHETLKARVTGVDVVLLDSRTFGDNISHDGQPLYVTIGLGDFNDRDEVLAWCAAQFPELSGAHLENQCTSSRLYP